MFSLDDYPLAWAANSLEPYISRHTVNFHYAGHLATYIKNLNALISGTKYEQMSLPNIILGSRKNPAEQKIFNNAAQIWNHNFFFAGLTKPSEPSKIPDKILNDFGTLEKFQDTFKSAALSVFGSGWVWLIYDEKLKIITSANADTPVGTKQIPLRVLDVWEHAYYLDYQNRRAYFVQAF